MSMEDIVKDLQHQIEALTKEVHYLNLRCRKLGHAKVADPKYPYYNWLLTNGVSEAQNIQIKNVLRVLTLRLQGIDPSTSINKNFSKVIADLLNSPNKPTFEEFKKIISSILNFDVSAVATEEELKIIQNLASQDSDIDTDNDTRKFDFDVYVSEILDAANKQGIYSEICTYLLDDMKKTNGHSV